MWPEMSKSSTETRAASSERERKLERRTNFAYNIFDCHTVQKEPQKNKTKNKKLRQYLLLLCSATISASANSAFVVLKILILSTYIHKNQTWFVVWKLDSKLVFFTFILLLQIQQFFVECHEQHFSFLGQILATC
jgi:hypothetical protein